MKGFIPFGGMFCIAADRLYLRQYWRYGATANVYLLSPIRWALILFFVCLAVIGMIL